MPEQLVDIDAASFNTGNPPVWNPNKYGTGLGGWVPASIDLTGASYSSGQFVSWNGSAFVPSTPAGGVVLDSTASDIQSLGSASATGSTGKAADAGHVHPFPRVDQLVAPTGPVAFGSQKITGLAPGVNATDAATVGQASTARTSARNAAIGFKDQAFDLYATPTGATSGLTSQAVWFVLCGFNAGDVITNILTLVTTAGAGTAPTGIYLGIYNTSGVQQAVTANLSSSSIWTSIGFAVAPLSSPFTVPSTGVYYLAILQNGTFATTAMAIMARSLNPAQVKTIGSGPPFGGVQSGQATLPSTASVSANTSANMWMGWS